MKPSYWVYSQGRLHWKLRLLEELMGEQLATYLEGRWERHLVVHTGRYLIKYTRELMNFQYCVRIVQEILQRPVRVSMLNWMLILLLLQESIIKMGALWLLQMKLPHAHL